MKNMRIANWIKNIFNNSEEVSNKVGFNPDNNYITKETKEELIIRDSQTNIQKLKDLVKLSEGTKYENELKEILDFTCKIHDRIIEDDNIDISKLESFHMHKTIEFISTFDYLFEELKPKKEVNNKHKSDYEIKLKENYNVDFKNLNNTFEYHNFNIDHLLNEHLKSNDFNKLKTNIIELIYNYFKEYDYGFKLRNNDEIYSGDLVDSYIKFLSKNTIVKENDIYIATTKDNDCPLLLDTSDYEVYVFDYYNDIKGRKIFINDESMRKLISLIR